MYKKMISKEEIEIDHTKDSFCVRIPLITEQELKRIDDNLESITDEITKQVIHDKDLAIAQHIIQKQKDKIDQLEQEKESTYWKGYIQKQQEAMEICKMCKYRKQYFERNAEEAKQYFEKKVEEK